MKLLLRTKDLKQLELNSIDIIKEAGEAIVRKWHTIDSIQLKDKRDIVTNVDIEIENSIRSQLHKLLPEAGFIVEEGKTEKKDVYNWVIDPIDGTKFFVHSLPMFFTQIALLYKGEPVLGVTYNPTTAQLFSASFGNGCFLNGKQYVSSGKARTLDSSIIEVDFGGSDNHFEWKHDLLYSLLRKAYRIRMCAGFLSVYMVTGAIDAYLHFSNINSNFHKYTVDLSPHIIILREFGVHTEVIQIPKVNKRVVLSADKPLFDEILSLFSNLSI